MTILSLDPSSAATGWALYEDNIITLAGFSLAFKPEKYEGDRYRKAYDWVRSLVRVTKPDHIAIEGYFFSKKFATGTDVNSEIRGVMKMALADCGVDYEVINPSDWKRALCGRTTSTRQEKKKYGKEKSKKLMTVHALVNLGLKCPKRIINPHTNRKSNFKFDVSDALGILLFYLSKNNLDFEFADNIWNFEVVE